MARHRCTKTGSFPTRRAAERFMRRRQPTTWLRPLCHAYRCAQHRAWHCTDNPRTR